MISETDIKFYTKDGKELMDVTVFEKESPVNHKTTKPYFILNAEGRAGKWEAGEIIPLNMGT